MTDKTRRHIPLAPTCAQPHACPLPVRLHVLSRAPLFHGLNEEELRGIDARMVSLAWAEGDPLYGEGDPAEHLYVLASGRAKATRTQRDGQVTIVDLLGPGDLFGGLEILGQPVQAETVTALTTVCALRVGTATFREILVAHPRVALHALDATAAQLARARAHVSEASAPVAQRVAATLLRLTAKFGQERRSGTLIQVPLPRADLAGMVSSTPESVSRVISQWRRDGLVEAGRRWISVVDSAALEAIAAGD